jgi:signal transduction histidine kinase
MKRISVTVIVGIFLLGLVGYAHSGPNGTRAEAEAMVKKAVAYIKAVGEEKAFAEISNLKGKFVDRDLYVVVYDLNGKCLAHGQNPNFLVGKDLIGMRDPDGKYYVKERVELAKTKSQFWQNYKFSNPLTKKIEPKSMYMEKVGNLLVGCGVYKKL